MSDPRPSDASAHGKYERAGAKPIVVQRPVAPPGAKRRSSSVRNLSARGVALQALVALDDGARANLVVPDLLERCSLDERDRHLVTELVYGTCRMRRACGWLVDRHTTQRRAVGRDGPGRNSSRGLDPEVRSALLMGAYQLGWTRIPAHAAVAATVGEVRGPGRALVNAVLRRVANDLAEGPPKWPDAATELSYPDWVVELLSSDLGASDAWDALMSMNRAGSVSRRADGYIQDPASQMVARYVASVAGDGPLLDMCAAPGGKATALAASGVAAAEPRLVVAADISEERSRVVAANAAAVGSVSLATVVADAKESPWRPGSFATVLLDAPCSGLGVLRRRPDARWRRKRSDVARLALLQRHLATSAWDLLRPGGTFVFSVCTISAAETVEIDRWLEVAAPWLTPLAPPGPPWRRAGRGALLLPQDVGSDGMFLLGLRSTGTSARLGACP